MGIWAGCSFRIRVCRCVISYGYDVEKNLRLRLLIVWTGAGVGGHVQDVEARVEQHEQE
jgi:hypothetical protein